MGGEVVVLFLMWRVGGEHGKGLGATAPVPGGGLRLMFCLTHYPV